MNIIIFITLDPPPGTWRAVYTLLFHILAHGHIRFSEELWAWEPDFLIKREMRMKMSAMDGFGSMLHAVTACCSLVNGVSLKLKAPVWYICNPDCSPHLRWCFSKASGHRDHLHAEAQNQSSNITYLQSKVMKRGTVILKGTKEELAPY